MKIMLVDGNSVLFRAFYATAYGNIMKTSKGVYTNAIYAFANMLEKGIRMIEPDYLAVAFDKGKHTFRHDLNPDYKAGRKETPVELVGQFELVREMMDAYHIPYFEYDGIEADDIVGTLSKKFNIEACVLSSDRDMLQLIDNNTSIYMMHKGMSEVAKMDEKALMDEWGLKPYQIIEYKGLAGDTSDNIKGVEGVGDKTAKKLLVDYDTCEGIYEHIDEIKGKLKEKLLKDKESCFLSKTLAKIATDVDVPVELEDLKLNIDEASRNAFFEKYEMYSLIRQTSASLKKKEETKAESVNKIDPSLLNNPMIHVCSNEYSYYERKIDGLSFSNGEKAQFITLEDLRNDKETLEFLASDNKKTVFDLKAIMHAFDFNKLSIGKNTDDLMLKTFLSNNYNSDLKAIFMNYGYGALTEIKEIYGTEKKPLNPDTDTLASYSVKIADTLYKINERVNKELEEKEMISLYEDIELPLTEVLYSMEKEGIHCEEAILNDIGTITLAHINSLEEKIYRSVGHSFNIASPKQLADVLYNELDLPDLKKGSTAAEVLQKLTKYHPVVSDVLDYRKYTKIYSTYAEGLKKYITPDQKIHTIFSQTITATGRLSSYDPNLQNISVRDEESKEIRKAFLPEPGCVLLSSDYSQVELRVLASLSGEEKMINAFNSGIDIHTQTAMDVFGVSKDEVTDLVRRHAKAVNFGVVYGISDFGLAAQTKLSFSDAKRFIEEYFKTYPKIKVFLDEQVEFCQKNGYVKTMQNRRRYINEINDRNYMMREFGKRAAMNATIQGSAADLIKIAMIKAYELIKERKLKTRLILQVHDELIFNVPEDELELMKTLIPDLMTNAYSLKTRLDSSLAYGKDWTEAK